MEIVLLLEAATKHTSVIVSSAAFTESLLLYQIFSWGIRGGLYIYPIVVLLRAFSPGFFLDDFPVGASGSNLRYLEFLGPIN